MLVRSFDPDHFTPVNRSGPQFCTIFFYDIRAMLCYISGAYADIVQERIQGGGGARM